MIPFATVQTFFSTMATSLSIPIIMADQDGTEPARPYITYKIINENVEHPRSNIRRNTAAVTTPGSETSYIKIEEKSIPVISITVRGKNQGDMAATRETARKLLHYMKLQDAITILYNTAIEDRTTFIGGEYDYKIGFDFRIDYRDDYTLETVERMNTIESEREVNDTAIDDLIISRDSAAIVKH